LGTNAVVHIPGAPIESLHLFYYDNKWMQTCDQPTLLKDGFRSSICHASQFAVFFIDEAAEPSVADDSMQDIGAPVGIAVALFLLLIGVVVLVICLIRYKKRKVNMIW
jgi:hypothetical protein